MLTAAALIEFIGALILAVHALQAAFSLHHPRAIEAARQHLAQGAIAALDFKTAATLLKAMALLSWDQIGVFTVTLALRIILKRVFQWERRRTGAR